MAQTTTTSTMLKKIANFAFYSRLMVLLMQVFFNYLMPDHDAKVFEPPDIHKRHLPDRIVEFILKGYHRWDAVYFTHIAEHGYTYENSLAFFPLYPLLVRTLANSALFPLQYFMNYLSVLMIASALINLVLFVEAAKVLFHLSYRVLDDEVLAFKSAQLFCINPASIFFSASYSETLFCVVAFHGMLKVQDDKHLVASLLFGISGLARANGISNCGFILYVKFVSFVRKFNALQKQKSDMSELGSVVAGIVSLCCCTLGSAAVCMAACLLPFILYQAYTYTVFCNPTASYRDMPNHILNYGNSKAYKMPHTGLSEWCHHPIPMSYSYVQANHWDVGFLRYYEAKQLPNFCLAAPMVALCVSATVNYIYKNFSYFISFGLHDPRDDEYKKTDEEKQEEDGDNSGIHNKKCYVYIVHMTVLLLFGVLCMHVQVITRFMASSSPVVYWFISTITTPKDQLKPRPANQFDVYQTPNPNKNGLKPSPTVTTSSQNGKADVSDDMIDWDYGWFNKTIFIYFHLYFFVGIAAFSNFLPWT